MDMGERLLREQVTNEATWQVLQEHGVREGQPLDVEFVFFARRREQAEAARTLLEALDATVDITSHKKGVFRTETTLTATLPMEHISLDALDEAAAVMLAITQQTGAEYDGWEAAPVPA